MVPEKEGAALEVIHLTCLKLGLDKMNYPLQSPFITYREAAQEFSSDQIARWLG